MCGAVPLATSSASLRPPTWLHHLVADAEFMGLGLSWGRHVTEWRTHPEVDFCTRWQKLVWHLAAHPSSKSDRRWSNQALGMLVRSQWSHLRDYLRGAPDSPVAQRLHYPLRQPGLLLETQSRAPPFREVTTNLRPHPHPHGASSPSPAVACGTPEE